jgi:hypothetical protein
MTDVVIFAIAAICTIGSLVGIEIINRHQARLEARWQWQQELGPILDELDVEFPAAAVCCDREGG